MPFVDYRSESLKGKWAGLMAVTPADGPGCLIWLAVACVLAVATLASISFRRRR